MESRRKILDLFEEQKEYWEERTKAGIEENRKGNATIKICDNNGKEISGACVKACQKSHEFRFGANLFLLDELESEEKNEKYKKYFSDVFNMATLPFYWDTLEPERGKPRYAKDSPKIYRRPAPDLCIEFCEEHGIEPREHALAYDSFFAKWLCGAEVDEIKRELERRCSEISERYADKIRTIEVTNELTWDSCRTKFYNEPDYLEWCFKVAEKYFPNNQLGINEAAGVVWNDVGRYTDKYYSYIEAAMLKGARIDAIGMQYHLFHRREEEYAKTRNFLNPEKLYKIMDLYSTLGKPLQLTEITVPAYSWESEDEELQAELIEKLYSIWFSHPAMEQIIYWNLVDGYAHVWATNPDEIAASQGDMTRGENYYHGGLLRFDMTPKPAYNKLKELTQKVWHTEKEIKTDANGIASFRGFYGKYDIEITVDGKTVTKEINLSKKSDNKFEIII